MTAKAQHTVYILFISFAVHAVILLLLAVSRPATTMKISDQILRVSLSDGIFAHGATTEKKPDSDKGGQPPAHSIQVVKHPSSERLQDVRRGDIALSPVAVQSNRSVAPVPIEPFRNEGARAGSDKTSGTISARPSGPALPADSLGKAGSISSGEGSLRPVSWGRPDAPAFLYRALPAYPPLARRLGKEGKVVLLLMIDKYGRLQRVDIVESAPYGFTEAAMEAVRQSTYAPARQNGVNVAAMAILPVRFKLE